jgi:hypothetical protein
MAIDTEILLGKLIPPTKLQRASTKGLFGSVAIHWMAGDIHFFSGYPVFGLEGEGDRDSHFRLKTVVEHIPQNMVDEGNHFRLSYSEAFSLPLTY